ncbi:MAG: hypothetical protein LBV23_01320 [Deltaproteobacteria bacterium]|nr:hypothetical protein [Deltaproteobacteria bacterium]
MNPDRMLAKAESELRNGRGVEAVRVALKVRITLTVHQVFFPQVAAGSDFRVVIKF